MARKKAEEKKDFVIDVQGFYKAIHDIETEYKISEDDIKKALADGFAAAYKNQFNVERNVTCVLNEEKQIISIYAYRSVVEEVNDPKSEISLEEAKSIKDSYEVGEVVLEQIYPEKFSRIASSIAQQVILQRLTEARNEYVKNEMNAKTGEIMNAVVRRKEGQFVYVEIANLQLEGVMMPLDQIRTEKYNVNDHIRVFIKKVRETNHGGTQVIVSRASAGYVKALLRTEIPEIRVGSVKVMGVVREAGFRTKIAVYSDNPNIDPVSACIGPKGIRINEIIRDIGGEKVDVIEYTADPMEYIARALSPAQVMVVSINEDDKTAKVIVPDEKLSLAIGKNGQNARLAAKLTGWKIDVKPYSSTIEEQSTQENQ